MQRVLQEQRPHLRAVQLEMAVLLQTATLPETAVPQMTAELNAIIDGLKPITEYDLDGVEPTFHPIGDLSNVMRPDAEAPGFTQEVALMNAAARESGCFRVPRILGGGDA